MSCLTHHLFKISVKPRYSNSLRWLFDENEIQIQFSKKIESYAEFQTLYLTMRYVLDNSTKFLLKKLIQKFEESGSRIVDMIFLMKPTS